MDFIDVVYATLTGQLENGYGVPGVENSFAAGAFCTEQYHCMRDAYDRLCERLGVEDEDDDVEIIIRSFYNIQAELCRKMYQYGAKFGK